MKIATIEYTRRRPLEQYGHEELKAIAHLEDDEGPLVAAIELKSLVNTALTMEISDVGSGDFDYKDAQDSESEVGEDKMTGASEEPVAKDIVEEKIHGESAPQKVKRGRKAKPKDEPTEELPGKVINTAGVETDEEIEAEKEKPKKLRKAGSPYDRNNPIHKNLFSEKLNELFPNWRDTRGKAKDASLDLEGEEMLDADGNMLKAFIAKLVERMS